MDFSDQFTNAEVGVIHFKLGTESRQQTTNSELIALNTRLSESI